MKQKEGRIKECPFCDNKKVVVELCLDNGRKKTVYRVKCEHCGLFVAEENKGKAIKRWNKIII